MLTEIEHNKRIGSSILHYRLNYKNLDKKRLGTTQSKLGQKVGVTFQQIQKYEKGTNGVSSHKLIAISKALNVKVIDLIILAYQDIPNMSCLYEEPMETVAEINVKEQLPKDTAYKPLKINEVRSSMTHNIDGTEITNDEKKQN